MRLPGRRVRYDEPGDHRVVLQLPGRQPALVIRQLRRTTGCALQEAMRRVATIALVHETLSEGLGETVDVDEVVGRTLSLAVELAAPSGQV